MYFQSVAGYMQCFPISLSCCLADISQVAGGATGEYSHIENGVVSGRFQCQQLA